eukprot:CAMPEP_0179447360 /NCGR_PEP_ID=MMETSP0799-20121207/31223_1 /TAXON_ID=46947 /ORGANISM="Geminigera cryophila, Strain CCMP2564" /LENGTH=50 /DNA_ID=CAMNT_0021238159 /DNA_START=576 /DNA_END=728 /DNA_ORIENTATION=-
MVVKRAVSGIPEPGMAILASRPTISFNIVFAGIVSIMVALKDAESNVHRI